MVSFPWPVALEGGPRGEAERRCHVHTGGRHLEIAPRHRNLEDALLLVELSFCARELFDLRRVRQGAGCDQKRQRHHEVVHAHSLETFVSRVNGLR
jgi:hypothetical protein